MENIHNCDHLIPFKEICPLTIGEDFNIFRLDDQYFWVVDLGKFEGGLLISDGFYSDECAVADAIYSLSIEAGANVGDAITLVHEQGLPVSQFVQEWFDAA